MKNLPLGIQTFKKIIENEKIVPSGLSDFKDIVTGNLLRG